ncbi:hypothetical protein GQ53DRAFT_417361 [Thozetella sp. PMI_491]|nr:hypothetical protein GQ53DRAFT_417361 [Thozetella sp. PMI_491]
MDSIIPMGGFQMPFQRRLSRLYNDTKKSSDFVKEPVQSSSEADPEIKALHRKLRIQKDRLVSWGLEWSDPNQQSAEVLIDSSLSKAGLSEVVGSIMSTIKDILAEAEPLWNSSRRLAGERVETEKAPVRGEKIQLVVWDKNRFEDLVRDLTTSIDTLYDLSRTRSSYAQSSAAARERLFKSASSVEDLRPFESSRMQTPQQIDPSTLTNLRSMQAEPMTEAGEEERSREVVFMSKQAYSALTQSSASRPTYAPLLLEFAPFDSIYSTTGIMPPMTRFERLSSGLQTEPQRSPGSWTGLPRLLGYFEDMEHSRLGLVYHFPATFNPVSFEHLTQNPLYNLCSLADLLSRPDFEPKLEAKFRLAANLANTVFDMHARGITHGHLIGSNVSFCNAVGTDPGVSGISQGEVDIRRPLISSFDLFSEPASQDESTVSLYKHPLDPRSTAQSPLANNADSKTFDLYSLAMALLSIGLWTNLENLVPDPSSPAVPESVLEQLAIRCGTLYMKAVQTCWTAVDQEMTGQLTSEQVVARVQLKASRYLEACCILDGVSNLEERLGDDLGEERPAPPRLNTSSSAGPSKEMKSEKLATPTSPNSGRTEKLSLRQASEGLVSGAEPEAKPKEPSHKTRLYPQVPLPPDAVEQWNKVLMPQINIALRHFYHKNLESVEISLESIGESPLKTKPTVLVVCTSVSKVRAILKKKLGALFDGTTGFALKVCRGQVLRSRNHKAGRSMAGGDGEEVTAANPDFQERPHNGASIGAWIGDRHLPPVSFGGLIMVDDKPYGMTVHHMLDDPDQEESTPETKEVVPRSMARGQGDVNDLAAWYASQYQGADSEGDSSGSEDYACEFSDSDSDTFSESAITSQSSEEDYEDDDGQYFETGDIPGVEPGCGEGYIVTQPALDDVDEGFYPSSETQDEDHLDTYGLGEVYASSGIRRRSDDAGLIHEIDWALFEFNDDRQPDDNSIPCVPAKAATNDVVHPTAVVPASSLPGLEVQCMARTSGLQTGLILPTLTSVKIYGRTSASHTYQVSGGGGPRTSALPMGIPGDSGAWIVDRQQGKLCGHILAWSERKRVAYICPMEVLLEDIIETLEASEIRLPGGQTVIKGDPFYLKKARASRVTELGEGNTEGNAPGPSSQGEQGQSQRLGHTQQRSRGAGEEGYMRDEEDDGDDSYDEGVEVDLTHDLSKLRFSTQSMQQPSERWHVR